MTMEQERGVAASSVITDSVRVVCLLFSRRLGRVRFSLVPRHMCSPPPSQPVRRTYRRCVPPPACATHATLRGGGGHPSVDGLLAARTAQSAVAVSPATPGSGPPHPSAPVEACPQFTAGSPNPACLGLPRPWQRDGEAGRDTRPSRHSARPSTAPAKKKSSPPPPPRGKRLHGGFPPSTAVAPTYRVAGRVAVALCVRQHCQ